MGRSTETDLYVCKGLGRQNVYSATAC